MLPFRALASSTNISAEKTKLERKEGAKQSCTSGI
jgi:hypothetical protein